MSQVNFNSYFQPDPLTRAGMSPSSDSNPVDVSEDLMKKWGIPAGSKIQPIDNLHTLHTEQVINSQKQRETSAALLRTINNTDPTGLPNPPLSSI
jgi:hypothetical protein